MPTFDYTQGDPALILNEEGANIEIKGGQPVMDQGIRNAALISLFTDSCWCGNALFADANQKIGSDYEKTARQAITLSAIQKIQSAAERALKWMVDSGLALAALARVLNPQSNRLETTVLIEPPSRDFVILTATRHGANWIAQRDNPAYRRLTNNGR